MSAVVRRGVRLLTAHLVVVVTVLTFAASGVVLVLARQAQATDHVGDRAVVDAAAGADLTSEVSAALGRLFSYDHTDPAPTRQAARQLLAGRARSQYDLLFDTLEQKAAGQRLVLRASVQVAGVQQLRGDRARLLVFLDQSAQRATDAEASVSAAQLVVDARRSGRTWRIVGLTPR